MSIKYDYKLFLEHKHDLLLDEDEINRVSIIMGLKFKNYGNIQCQKQKTILMLLNKISKTNNTSINKQIKELLITPELINFTIENLFKCSILQPSFQSLYAETCKNITYRNPNIRNILKTKCVFYLEKYINDENKENLKLLYHFISELFIVKVYNTNIIIDHFNIIYSKVEEDNSNIELLCSLINGCYKNLCKNLGNNGFKEKILDKLENILTMNIKPRLKFMIKDITDNINIDD